MGVTRLGRGGKRKGGGTAGCQLNGTRNRGSDSQQQSWEGDEEGRTKEVGATGVGWGGGRENSARSIGNRTAGNRETVVGRDEKRYTVVN